MDTDTNTTSPSPSPSPSPTATASPSPTATASPSPSPNATTSPSPTPTTTGTPRPTATGSPSPTPTKTGTPTPTPTSYSIFDSSGNMAQLTNSIFNKSTFTILFWFLAIYLVFYFGLNLFSKKEAVENNNQMLFSRSIDVIILGLLIITLLSTYFSLSADDQTNLFGYIVQWLKNYLNNPNSFIEAMILIVVFYATILLFRIPMGGDVKPLSIGLIEQFFYMLFAILLIVNFFKYILGIPIIDILIRNEWLTSWNNLPDSSATNVIGKTSGPSSGPSTDSSNCSTDPTRSPANATDQVFNISNNKYTFNDAQAICKSYGSRLATYNEIEDSYNKGGEWCNYGWSDGQMAFFPTQKTSWDKLQKQKGHENDCGRPGVNGGYMKNPNARFGVNCFGQKPAETDADIARLASNVGSLIPKTQAEIDLAKKMDEWKKRQSELELNAFNQKKWSQY